MTAEYLAGFFDGEGCLLMVVNATTKRHLIYPRLVISNTNREILEEIARDFGGRVNLKNRNADRPQWKVAYQWTTTSMDETRFVLMAMKPHLRVKHKQADAMLAWFRMRTMGVLTPEKSMATRQSIQALNRRGKEAA